MKYVILEKNDFNQFISELLSINKVVAPVSKGYKNYSFQEITSGSEISLYYIPTILPPKKYFMPQEEKILDFDKSKEKSEGYVEYEKIILFAVYTCDLAGIQCLNLVFDENPKDLNYAKRKENVTIIGFECNNYCDEYASCAEMNNHIPKGGYDLFMTDIGDKFIIHVNSSNGEDIVKRTHSLKEASASDIKLLDSIRDRKRQIFKNETSVPHGELKNLFDKSIESSVWDNLSGRCLACGNCTNVCPTCYCFDLIDDINFDFITGSRIRKWDSCQTETFAQVAGNENFREERSARQRHRYMRKFSYPIKKWDRYFCTGCGRCSRTCMAKINLKQTINELAGK